MKEKDLEGIDFPDPDANWTWWDDDRDVAWGVAESYYGKLATLYFDNGWSVCYHNGGARFHINVKVHGKLGLGADTAARLQAKYPEQSEDRIRDILQARWDDEMEWWWEQLDGGVEYLLSEERNTRLRLRTDVWSGGRSGGWLHVSNAWAATHPEEMILLAIHVKESKEYYDSKDWYDYLYEQTDLFFQDEKEAEEAAERRNPLNIIARLSKEGPVVIDAGPAGGYVAFIETGGDVTSGAGSTVTSALQELATQVEGVPV